ncbi:Nucleolar protein 12 [Frankliniella fusca]|uniref:Nucleolar protein 12 n=1 Tax=Frankliniella fusca TaxID=407009 RepID=A0AAE1HYG5_9NEOP|nr:Nucleolar protein 12 [Frankliniella fusca]
MEGTSKKRKRGQKKRKINLVFDPQARREFLTGFHKRKVERKAKFQENLKQMLKDERKRIKADAKESYKKMVVSHRSVPEVEHLLEEEHDLGTHSVEIKELSTNELAEQNNWIGANQMKYDVKEEASEDEDDKGNESDQSDSQLIPGMGLKANDKKTISVSKETKSSELKSAKDIKRVIKLQATKQVKKSKVYQLKNKIEKMKQKKKSLQQKKRNAKVKESGKKGKRLKKRRAAQGD